MRTVLVTGATGLLGREVAAQLTAAGHHVRSFSRSTGAFTGDLVTGAGLDRALRDVDTVVHCATDPRHPADVDVAGTRRLLSAAAAARASHVVYVSIVGVDRIPWGFYRAKLAAEAHVATAGLPWTVLRATQFHEFALGLVEGVARLPVVPLPRGWHVQPVDVTVVAARLAAAVDAGPAGRLPDLGGPDVLSLAELARGYLQAVGRSRPVLTLPVPGRLSAAFRAGANLAPEQRGDGRDWTQFLADRFGRAVAEGGGRR